MDYTLTFEEYIQQELQRYTNENDSEYDDYTYSMDIEYTTQE